MVQWLRLRGPNAGGPGLIPDQGTGSRMLQLKKILHAATKIPCAPTKTWRSQINLKKKNNWKVNCLSMNNLTPTKCSTVPQFVYSFGLFLNCVYISTPSLELFLFNTYLEPLPGISIFLLDVAFFIFAIAAKINFFQMLYRN